MRDVLQYRVHVLQSYSNYSSMDDDAFDGAWEFEYL